MNMIELDRALRKLRLSGMAGTLQTRLVQAQAEKMVPLDLVSVLVSDELTRREDRLCGSTAGGPRCRAPDRNAARRTASLERRSRRFLRRRDGASDPCEACRTAGAQRSAACASYAHWSPTPRAVHWDSILTDAS